MGWNAVLRHSHRLPSPPAPLGPQSDLPVGSVLSPLPELPKKAADLISHLTTVVLLAKPITTLLRGCRMPWLTLHHNPAIEESPPHRTALPPSRIPCQRRVLPASFHTTVTEQTHHCWLPWQPRAPSSTSTQAALDAHALGAWGILSQIMGWNLTKTPYMALKGSLMPVCFLLANSSHCKSCNKVLEK